MEKYKVIIIGSGISGMTSAIYLKRGGIDPLIIETSAPGGVLNNIPNIENYPGYLNISGPDLAMNIYNQVTNLNIKYKNIKIETIDLDKKIINNNIEYEYLIIATGRRAKYLNLPNEKELLGKGISTCALCDGYFYKNEEVAVVGGASSALTEAIYLSSICKKVTLIIRKNKLTAEKYLIEKINNIPNINIIYNSNITSYNKEGDILSSITLNKEKTLKTKAVFLAIGSTPNSEIFSVEKEDNYIITDNQRKTNKAKTYAIGDVIKKDYYQLSTAINDATIAALDIINNN